MRTSFYSHLHDSHSRTFPINWKRDVTFYKRTMITHSQDIRALQTPYTSSIKPIKEKK